jgi:hypothetical protein
MEEAFGVLRIAVAAVVGVFVLATSDAAIAKEKGKGSADAAPSAKRDAAKGGPPPGETVNACGCYHDAKGGCACTDKKGKCECPGECEPVGCGAKRDKEMDREMAAEIKRAQDDEKRRAEAQGAKEAKDNGATDAPDAGEPPVAGGAKPAKSSRKEAAGKTGTKPESK